MEMICGKIIGGREQKIWAKKGGPQKG